jgi:hypothetical protein
MQPHGGFIAAAGALSSDMGAKPHFATCATSSKLLHFLSLQFFVGKCDDMICATRLQCPQDRILPIR